MIVRSMTLVAMAGLAVGVFALTGGSGETLAVQPAGGASATRVAVGYPPLPYQASAESGIAHARRARMVGPVNSRPMVTEQAD